MVNNEISELISSLSKSCNLVSNKGIILTVSFHSIEDKICKFFLIQFLPTVQYQDICQ